MTLDTPSNPTITTSTTTKHIEKNVGNSPILTSLINQLYIKNRIKQTKQDDEFMNES